MLNQTLKVHHREHGDGIATIHEVREDGAWMFTLSAHFPGGISVIAPVSREFGDCADRDLEINLFDLVGAFVEVERMG